jgi:four helix bundle suffix protein
VVPRRPVPGRFCFAVQGSKALKDENFGPKSSLSTKVYPELEGNAVLVLIAVACALLDRQMARLAEEFENKGGFS